MKNPIVEGYYADPEARFYEGKYYIYVTKSFTNYGEQLNLDAFSSEDMVHWEKHPNIIDMSGYPYIHRSVWAPTIIERAGKYYLIFASNDIQSDEEIGGLEIAVSDHPYGPFVNHIGKTLVDHFIYHAQPIDAHLFKDDDGVVYLYYGGWKHCNVAVMNAAMDGFVPFEDGTVFRPVTPENYVEGPCMLKRKGKYYFMWSEGDWVNGGYHACVSCSDSPLSINPKGKVILNTSELADGPGHNGYLNIPGTDEWRIVYHRRIIGDSEPGHRVLCIDRLDFQGEEMQPVIMT